MTNLAELSRQDGERQGIAFDFRNYSGRVLFGFTELIDPRFIAMYTHRRYGIL